MNFIYYYLVSNFMCIEVNYIINYKFLLFILLYNKLYLAKVYI